MEWNRTMDNTILVVEDDPELQEVLTLNLQNAGYRVMRAGTVRQAEQLVNSSVPQLIVLDWMLPDTPGLTFARKLRSERRTAAVPIILLTGRSGESDKITGLEAGADDYLYKPLRERELRARVASLLRLRRAMVALESRQRELESANAALNEAQAALVRAGKLASVGTLAAGLAHEINNPLSYIKAGARSLVRSLEEIGRLCPSAAGAAPAGLAEAIADAREVATEMLEGSQRLERIAGDLRVIASPDAPADEAVDPKEAVESAFLLARSRFPALPRLELEVEPGPPIESVGRLLTQGLLPVVENAVQVSGPGGLITVRIRQLNVGVEISIQDSGP
ncbi:MAG TPA: response regulator, partial [Usitatibacter sp.]|nr:response regulator [Usitatibacter sp.]